MNHFTTFEAMCEAVGASGTEAQVMRLADYVRNNFGCGDYASCAEIALTSDAPESLYTELSMMCGESGVSA